MKQAIGIWFILSVLIFGYISLFETELSLIEKVEVGLFGLFTTLFFVWSYLLG